MGTIDIIILCLLLAAIVHGLVTGLVRQVVSMTSIYLGARLSIRFSGALSEWMVRYLEMNLQWLNIIAFILIFLATAIILRLIGNLVEKIIKVSLLGWLNRLFGAVASVLTFAFAVSIIIFLFDTINGLLPMVSAEVLDKSKFYHPLLNFANIAFPYLKSLF